MRFKWTILLLAILVGTSVFAQKKPAISGTVKDAVTGETLVGATVLVKELPQTGAATNAYGFYSLTAAPGAYTIVYSFVGYAPTSVAVDLQKDTVFNIALNPKSDLQEVVISNRRRGNENVQEAQMGVEKLDMQQLSNVPVIFGEKDILKTISLLPGVQAAAEGNTGYYVRGGASDQNLILLDEAPVYNASHLFGFFSTFNSDAIKDATLYKGGMPAQYGGRLSSVLDVRMNEGNNKTFTLDGGIGLISSRIKAEGPIEKDKGSFMISARRTYIDFFLKAASDTNVRNSSIYFYDLNAKFNYHFNDRNTIYLSGYFGKDVLGLRNTFGTNWGNSTGTLRFNHIFNSHLFSNTSLIYSSYSYLIQSFLVENQFTAKSAINDFNFKEDMQYYINATHTLSFGINAVNHDLQPGQVSSSTATSRGALNNAQSRRGIESAAYVDDQWRLSSKINLRYGLRLSGMFLLGPGTFKTFDDLGNTTSSQTYNSGSLVKRYINLEPRLSLSYILNEQNSIKLSYNRNTQNIHILNNSNSSTPTDLYVLSSNNIKPEIGDQLSAGYFKNFDDNAFEFSVEAYHKWLQNQIDYKNGAQLAGNPDVESQLVYGSGRAYGLELYLKKRYGRFNGWISYTLSRTEGKFAAIDNGNYFPNRYDRTHDISTVGIYQLNKRWTLSATFVYGTGEAVTYPTGKYSVGGVTTYYYSSRNGYREPSTNHLDLGATLEGKPHPKYHSSWTFGIYNVYNRHNPYIISFRDSKTNPGTSEAVETSLFGIVPSATWNFRF